MNALHEEVLFSRADGGFCDKGGLEMQYTVAIWAG